MAIENYQEITKQTKAVVQFEFELCWLLLQQTHPVATLIITWAIVRATAAVKPRPSAGLRG